MKENEWPDPFVEALNMFPDTDPRHHRVVAYALQLASHRALQRADVLEAKQRAEIRAGS